MDMFDACILVRLGGEKMNSTSHIVNRYGMLTYFQVQAWKAKNKQI
jgi:hypothetical protein